MEDRHERAERTQARMRPDGSYSFEDKPTDCGGEGWYRNADGELVVCEGHKCH